MKPLVIDTSVWIDWLRGESAPLRERTEGRILFMPSVVAMELYSGARHTKTVRVVGDLVAPFSRHGRLISPSDDDFRRTGLLMADLKLPASKFSNDVLICMSARKIGGEIWSLNRADYLPISQALHLTLGP